MMKVFYILFLLTLAINFLAFDSGFCRETTESAQKDGRSLYEQAEEAEWFKANNMKEVDSLYDKAAKAGSDEAYMTRSTSQLFMADEKSGNRKKLASKLCPKMAQIAKKWREKDSPDADQLFHLARYYGIPWCKELDLKKTQTMLLKSAEMGNVKSQYHAGKMLAKKDSQKSCEWFEKAAESGFPQAVANLGACYLLGKGKQKDEKKGMELIEKAMASQNPNTLYEVAIWYLEGQKGLPQNTAKAEKILKQLIEADYEPAFLPYNDLKKAD